MVRATDFLKRHFDMPLSKASTMSYKAGVLRSIIRKNDTNRIKNEKEIVNAAEQPDPESTR